MFGLSYLTFLAYGNIIDILPMKYCNNNIGICLMYVRERKFVNGLFVQAFMFLRNCENLTDSTSLLSNCYFYFPFDKMEWVIAQDTIFIISTRYLFWGYMFTCRSHCYGFFKFDRLNPFFHLSKICSISVGMFFSMETTNPYNSWPSNAFNF